MALAPKHGLVLVLLMLQGLQVLGLGESVEKLEQVVLVRGCRLSRRGVESLGAADPRSVGQLDLAVFQELHRSIDLALRPILLEEYAPQSVGQLELPGAHCAQVAGGAEVFQRFGEEHHQGVLVHKGLDGFDNLMRSPDY